MALTAATGPFSKDPAGQFNFERPSGAVLFWEQVPYRVRALVRGDVVVDSRAVKLLHETGHLPVYYFPDADFRSDLLEPSQKTSHCPHKGDATYWSIKTDELEVPDAVWAYREPIESAGFLAGHRALVWSAIEEWFVEDGQVFGHPRDPYARIDVYPTTRHVRLLVDGEIVADSTRAQMLVETGLPPRYYVPRDDVRVELLEPSATKTRCAYKGSASYWHVRIGDTLHEDVLWTYRDPQHDGEPVRDLISFFQERADLEVDDEIGERPITQWSR